MYIHLTILFSILEVFPNPLYCLRPDRLTLSATSPPNIPTLPDRIETTSRLPVVHVTESLPRGCPGRVLNERAVLVTSHHGHQLRRIQFHQIWARQVQLAKFLSKVTYIQTHKSPVLVLLWVRRRRAHGCRGTGWLQPCCP